MDRFCDVVPPAASAAPAVDRALIEEVIADLKPHLSRDGGDIELVAVDGDTVIVDLKGSCVCCALSIVTLAGVRKRLVERTGRKLRVVPLSSTTIRREQVQ